MGASPRPLWHGTASHLGIYHVLPQAAEGAWPVGCDLQNSLFGTMGGCSNVQACSEH